MIRWFKLLKGGRFQNLGHFYFNVPKVSHTTWLDGRKNPSFFQGITPPILTSLCRQKGSKKGWQTSWTPSGLSFLSHATVHGTSFTTNRESFS